MLLNYNFDGEPRRFKIKKHGNRTKSNMPYIRSKKSTKLKVAEKAVEFRPKRALVLARKGAGGICDTNSISSLPRNMKKLNTLPENQLIE